MNTQQDNTHNDLSQIVSEYLDKGFEPVPLPPNEKFPPAEGTTGNIPALTAQQTFDVWQGRSETSNLAVRLPETLVGLDVDAHNDKAGAETLAGLEARLGTLPQTYTLSRHGADAPSRHYYYSVPRNIKFVGQAGKNIDVLQATHRYAVAWPSEVNGQTYEWFDPAGNRIALEDLPHVSKFPALPGAWLEELTKGSLTDARKYAPAEDFGSSEAMQWLASVAPGFAEPMPTAVEECVNKATAEFDATAHDTALRETEHLIRWSVLDGQVGLKAALEKLRAAFVPIVAARRGNLSSAENEFDNLVIDEVNTLRGQIEAGKATVYAATAGGQFIDKGLKIDVTSMDGAKAVEAAFAHRKKSSVAKPTITERLLEVIQPDADTRRFVQKSLGYSIFGKNKSHKFFVWYGAGGSGKGSVLDSVLSVMGEDYLSDITPEQFIKGSASRPDPEYSRSLQTRMTFVNETDEGTKISAAAIKRATEKRSGRALFSNEVVQSDANTITFMTNKPFSFDHDSGVARRLAVVPFDAQKQAVRDAQPPIAQEWRDNDEEKVWVLLWLLEGFVMAMSEGLETEDYPPLVAQATRGFIAEADPTMLFFETLERTDNENDQLFVGDYVDEFRAMTGLDEKAISRKQIEMKINSWFKDNGHDADKRRKDNRRYYRGWKCTVKMPRVLPMKPTA